MKNQKAVFDGPDEYMCTQFFDSETSTDGVDVSLGGKHLGEIWGITIPDIDDEEENIKFDKEVTDWINVYIKLKNK